jgi:hypothetical protein
MHCLCLGFENAPSCSRSDFKSTAQVTRVLMVSVVTEFGSYSNITHT